MHYDNIFDRLFHAGIYSLNGIIHAVKHEQAFRYELIMMILIFALIFLLNLSLIESLCVLFGWGMIMCFELINSAVEKAFDLIDVKFRPEIKAGKDMLSGAVFICVCLNIILWLTLIMNTIIIPS